MNVLRTQASLRVRITPLLERYEGRIAVAMLVLYAVVFGSLALIRHWAFHSTALDLGVFDQVLWNTVHGRFHGVDAQPRPVRSPLFLPAEGYAEIATGKGSRYFTALTASRITAAAKSAPRERADSRAARRRW